MESLRRNVIAIRAPGRILARTVDMRSGAGVVAIFILVAAGAAAAQQGKKAPPASAKPVKDMMLRTHKDKGALVFLVRDGESTEAQNKKLLEEYKALHGVKPPLGDQKSWNNRISNAVAALQDLVDKKTGSVERVRGATECSGCHNGHRVGGNK